MSRRLPPELARHGTALVIDGQAVIDAYVGLGIASRSTEMASHPKQFRRRLDLFRAELKAALEHHLYGTAEHPSNAERQDYSTWISTAEAAQRTGYTQRHCRELARRNGIGTIVRGRWLIDPAKLTEHVARQRLRSTPYDDDTAP